MTSVKTDPVVVKICSKKKYTVSGKKWDQ